MPYSARTTEKEPKESVSTTSTPTSKKERCSVLDHVGTSGDQQLVAAFEVGAPEVVGAELTELEIRARGAIKDEHSLRERRQVWIVGAGSSERRTRGYLHWIHQVTCANSVHYADYVKIYTRAGDDGTTGLYFGGRIAKSAEPIEVNGAVDEAQAALGWARSLCEPDSRINELLITLERDLWILMAEVATLPENRRKLVAEKSLVTDAWSSASNERSTR